MLFTQTIWMLTVNNNAFMVHIFAISVLSMLIILMHFVIILLINTSELRISMYIGY